MILCITAEWISAISTGGAFLIALYLLNLQRVENKKRIEDKDREIANQISTWIDLNSAPPRIYSQNLSSEPIYNLEVKLSNNYIADNLKDYPEFVAVHTYKSFGPKQKEHLICPKTNQAIDYNKIEVEISFKDTNGISWKRDKNGKIIKLPIQSA